MASRSRHRGFDSAVETWLAGQESLVATQGYITVHVDELQQLDGDGRDTIDSSLAAFSALIRHGVQLASRARLLLSLPLEDVDDAVPLSPGREATIWSELDSFRPPSLSVVDLRREHKLYDEETYAYPLVFNDAPRAVLGAVKTHYIATRSRVYRENEWNYVAAIVLEYFPEDRIPPS
jgi:hypothetical protein